MPVANRLPLEEAAPETAPRGVPVRVDANELALSHIRRALIGLRYGEVTVTVQDGVLVQIERKEKTRLR